MADQVKTLEEVALQLTDLRNILEGTLGESIPQKLEKPWKSFEKTNQELIECVDHIVDFLKKHKDREFDDEIRENFDDFRKKWQGVNNVYGGLMKVMGECKSAMECWDKAEKQLKKI